MALRILSLCSGIGGLDLGVELAVPGSRAVGYVEREAFAASVIMARMDDETLERAPVWCGDLRDLDARPLRGHVDLVTAGYPCQPFSLAGNRRGEADERHLWPEVARVVGEVGPRYVFLENVPGHLRLGFDRVLGDLADLGFDAEWTVVGADDVGAPHRRKRLFVLAHASRAEGRGEDAERRAVEGITTSGPCLEVADAGRLGLDGVQPGRRGGAGGSEETADSCDGEGVADADLRGRGDVRVGGVLDGERSARGDVADGCNVSLWPPGPDPELWEGIPPEAQPAIRGVADGTARGLERSRLAALGNGVVPLAAAYAFRTLAARRWGDPSHGDGVG